MWEKLRGDLRGRSDTKGETGDKRDRKGERRDLLKAVLQERKTQEGRHRTPPTPHTQTPQKGKDKNNSGPLGESPEPTKKPQTGGIKNRQQLRVHRA